MPETLVAPAHLWVPEHTSTAGGEAADLAASVGITLDPEQLLCLDAILAERPDGRWAAFEAAVVAARQNLKTFVFQVVVLADLYLFGSKLIVWSAHEFNTTMEAFREMKALVERHPHLSRRLKRVCEANGDEGIELHGGQRVRFRARTKTGGRGLTADRSILDEAFALTPAMMGSLMPTMSARSAAGNPQLVYGSSAGKADSGVLRAVRDRGRAGGDPRLVWVEWCAPVRQCAETSCEHARGEPGCVLDDQAMWGLANPAMGRRISEEWIASERRSMTPTEFARERLGWWEEPAGGDPGIPVPLWHARAVAGLAATPATAVAVDVTPDFAFAAVAQAKRDEGGTVLELVEHRRGTGWVAAVVADLRAAAGGTVPVVVDMGSPASVVAPDLVLAGIELVNPAPRDVAQGCAALVDGLGRGHGRGQVHHIRHPALDAAVAGSSRRPMGDGAWAWSRRASVVDISPLVAVTLALWGACLPDALVLEGDLMA